MRINNSGNIMKNGDLSRLPHPPSSRLIKENSDRPINQKQNQYQFLIGSYMPLPKALILVDLLEDFAIGGALPIKDTRYIAKKANEIMDQYPYVVSVEDFHPSNHCSFDIWPSHCLQGTFGANLVKELNLEKITQRIKKGIDIDIDSYSGFLDDDQKHETGLNDYLKEKKVEAVDIIGVATEYCVKATAIDAIKFGYDVTVLVGLIDGVGVKEGDEKKALDEMKEWGVKFKIGCEIV